MRWRRRSGRFWVSLRPEIYRTTTRRNEICAAGIQYSDREGTMYCPSCGSPNAEASRYCIRCRNPLPIPQYGGGFAAGAGAEAAAPRMAPQPPPLDFGVVFPLRTWLADKPWNLPWVRG